MPEQAPGGTGPQLTGARVDGDYFVYPDGRRLARVRGADDDAAPMTDTAAAALAVAERHAGMTQEPAAPAPEQAAAPPAGTSQEPPPDGQDDIDFGVDTTGHDPEAVQRLEAQFKAAMTRARQADRQAMQEQMQELEQARGIQELLSATDESARVEALNAILDRFGYPTLELVDGEGGEDPADPFAELDPDDPATQALRMLHEQQQAAEQARQQAAEQAAQEQTNEQLRSEGQQALAGYAEQRGLDLDTMPEFVRNQLVAYALAAPVTDQGGLDWENAVTSYEAARNWEIEQFIASKRGAPPRLEGGAGVKQFDPSNDKERIAASMAIAGRHLD